MERNDVILSQGRYSLYPKESNKIMLFFLLVLALRTLFSRFLGILTLQGQLIHELLSHWLYPLIDGPYEIIYIENWL
jgi:hypothetical protein